MLSTSDRTTGHRSSTVRFDGSHYLLVCECGWEAPPLLTPHAVGSSWEEHRSAAD